MTSQPLISPRDAADLIGMAPLRLIRLGRCLGMASMDRRIPLGLVHEVMHEDTPEARYRALVQALLNLDASAITSASDDRTDGRTESDQERRP